MDKIVKIKENCSIKESIFEVELEYYYNEKNDEYYTDSKLTNKNLKIIRNEYRRINNLLTDYEIKQIREKYGLSQKDFAIILGFGEITITRYETKQIQDKAQDSVIRLANKPEELLKLLEQNKEKYIDCYSLTKFNKLKEKIMHMTNNDEFNGNQVYSIEKVKAVIKQILVSNLKITKTKLAKLLWYCDFINYKNNNKSITGLKYLHLDFGAYPKNFEIILNNKDVEIVVEYDIDGDFTKKTIVFCNSDYQLSKDELDTIETVNSKFKNFTSKQIVDYMHKEKAYLETSQGDYISYNFAKDIKL